jgi:predicted dehydrogenase
MKPAEPATNSIANVLIVGCGNIAGGFDAQRPADAPPLSHAGAYSAHGGFKLLACVEPNATQRMAFMQRWGVQHGFADMRAAGAAGLHFDVVSICSPTAVHHADALQALSLKPRLVFCEKPLCESHALAFEMVQRCASQGVLLAVNHNRRWDLAVTQIRDEINSGAWGTLRSATGTYNKGVLNNGSHIVDLLRDLLGPLQVLSAGRPVADFWPNDPSIPALLCTAHGASVALNCGHAADYALFELQLNLENGSLVMEDGGMRWRIRRAGPSLHFAGYQALGEAQTVQGQYLQTMSRAVTNIYDAWATGAALASTGQSALETQLLCEEIRLLSKF